MSLRKTRTIDTRPFYSFDAEILASCCAIDEKPRLRPASGRNVRNETVRVINAAGSPLAAVSQSYRSEMYTAMRQHRRTYFRSCAIQLFRTRSFFFSCNELLLADWAMEKKIVNSTRLENSTEIVMKLHRYFFSCSLALVSLFNLVFR